MKAYKANDIRNIVLAGHGGKGKTTLAEAMLYIAGATDRLGRVADGNTVLDYDPEEKKRKTSVSTSVAPLEWKKTKINIIDTPGLFDYAGGLSEGMRAAECAVIVLTGKSGVTVGTEKAFKAASKRGIGKIFAITKLDSENTDFYKTYASLQESFGSSVCPVVIPEMVDGVVKSYVNLVDNKAYTYTNGKAAEVAVPDMGGKLEEMRDALKEAIASADDELMEKFFEGEEFTREELLAGLKKGIQDGVITPAYACAGYTADGVDLLLDAIVEATPSAASAAGEIATDESGNEVELNCDENGPLAAVVFKTIADPFIGKLSFFKVVSGKITSDVPAYKASKGTSERMGKIVTLRGGKQEDAAAIPAGDIGAVTKLSGIGTGDTVCSPSKVLTLKGIDFPSPCLSMAVKARKKGDEEKITAGLVRLMEEDKTITYKANNETREQILSGLGEQHLDVIVSKLKSKFGVEVDLKIPKVAYREAIKKKVKVQGRHKKQSGGHGQFGDVWMEFEPSGTEDQLIFEEKIFGGAVPKNFFPAVEKGLRDSVTKGVLAGYPMVGLKATLVDGSYHPVDSSEMSFKMAATLAYKAGIPMANPVLLEPIGMLKAYMPNENMGDIMGDVNKRRGRVLGMNPAEDKMQVLEAEVPMAEMGDFSTVLRSITAGRGYFTLEFVRYEEAPANIAQKVIEASKKDDEE